MAQEQIKQQNEETTVVSGDWFLMQKASTDETVKVDAGNIVPDGTVVPNKLMATTGSSWVWQDWTPTWTNLTVGNGTVVAKYTQIGKTVFFRLHFTYGTTSSISGLIGFTSPVTSIASTLQRDIIGNVLFDDTGLSNAIGFACFLGNTNRIDCYVTTASGTYASLAGSSATIPITFANGDTISVNGSYQVA